MSDRLQREIEDLLAGLDTFPPRRPLWRRIGDAAVRPFRSAARAAGSFRRPSISAGHLLLIAIAIIVMAYLLGRGSTDIGRWVIVGGIVLFLVAFTMSLRRHSRPPEKLWRGEPMHLGGPGAGDRIRSWWGRRRSRH